MSYIGVNLAINANHWKLRHYIIDQKNFWGKTHQITLVITINIHFQNTFVLLFTRIFMFAGDWTTNYPLVLP